MQCGCLMAMHGFEGRAPYFSSRPHTLHPPPSPFAPLFQILMMPLYNQGAGVSSPAFHQPPVLSLPYQQQERVALPSPMGFSGQQQPDENAMAATAAAAVAMAAQYRPGQHTGASIQGQVREG